MAHDGTSPNAGELAEDDILDGAEAGLPGLILIALRLAAEAVRSGAPMSARLRTFAGNALDALVPAPEWDARTVAKALWEWQPPQPAKRGAPKKNVRDKQHLEQLQAYMAEHKVSLSQALLVLIDGVLATEAMGMREARRNLLRKKLLQRFKTRMTRAQKSDR